MKLFFLFTLVSLLLPVWAQSNDYPGRTTYPRVNIYETSELNKSFNDVIIVDVRSAFEFDTLHILNAVNIPLNHKNFIDRIIELQAAGKPVIFYCNGHTCYKSYKAVEKCRRSKLTNIFSYDAGIFDWANTYPEKAALLGKTPIDKERLLGKEDLKKYLVEPDQFSSKINNKVEILDIREPAQRGLLELFPYRQQNIAMDDKEKLKKYLIAVKKAGKTLLVYDEAGKQVRWLQYYLEDIGIKEYYFMAGGIKKFFKALNQQ